jgi:thiol-disulfide isomerase/thioredoxin
MTHITVLASEEEFIKYKGVNSLCIVYFTAAWCVPCQKIAPIYEELSKKHTHIKFIKVDVDEADGFAQSQGIKCMPTFKIFKNGSLVEEILGENIESLKNAVVSLIV